MMTIEEYNKAIKETSKKYNSIINDIKKVRDEELARIYNEFNDTKLGKRKYKDGEMVYHVTSIIDVTMGTIMRAFLTKNGEIAYTIKTPKGYLINFLENDIMNGVEFDKKYSFIY